MGKFLKGVARPHTCGPRPQAWVTGTDPIIHKQYRVFIQQRNQANWREEGWSISFEDWRKIWGDLWDLRGRERGTYCMSRIDWSLPWTVNNVDIVTREKHAKLQGLARAKGWRSMAQKKAREKNEIVAKKKPGRKTSKNNP